MSSLALHRASQLAPVQSAREPVILPTLFCEGYGLYRTQRSTFVLSFLVHALGLALVLTSGSYLVEHRHEIRQQVIGVVTDVSPYILPPSASKAGGGGGGGDRDKLSASKGALPRLSRQQLAPPAVVVRTENPKLPVEATVVVPPEIHLPQTGSLGDPLASVFGPPSNGTGSGGGIGSGSGGGVSVRGAGQVWGRAGAVALAAELIGLGEG